MIWHALSDPLWWFSTVLAGLIVGVGSGLLKDRIDKLLAAHRRSAARRARERAEHVEALASHALSVLFYLGLAIAFLIMCCTGLVLAYIEASNPPVDPLHVLASRAIKGVILGLVLVTGYFCASTYKLARDAWMRYLKLQVETVERAVSNLAKATDPNTIQRSGDPDANRVRE